MYHNLLYSMVILNHHLYLFWPKNSHWDLKIIIETPKIWQFFETRHGLKKNLKKLRSLKIGLNDSQKKETTFVIYKKINLFI